MNAPNELVIVEKSKEARPLWLEEKADQLRECGKTMCYHIFNRRFSDIQVGLQKTRQTALESTKLALLEFTREQIKIIIKDSNSQSSSSVLNSLNLKTDLDHCLNTTITEYHKRYTQIADIYFERFSKPFPTAEKRTDKTGDSFFEIFVLVHFPKEHFPSLFNDIGSKLVNSSNQSLKSLGNYVKDYSATQMAH